ncbi:hypothetical protein KHP62_16975 [Rhodobacteraceae bacterium NNCM2]|nr:hypothetical protein [Coraliihabitans acroporae]
MTIEQLKALAKLAEQIKERELAAFGEVRSRREALLSRRQEITAAIVAEAAEMAGIADPALHAAGARWMMETELRVAEVTRVIGAADVEEDAAREAAKTALSRCEAITLLHKAHAAEERRRQNRQAEQNGGGTTI